LNAKVNFEAGCAQVYTVAEVAQRYRVRPGWVTDHCTGKRQPVLPGMKIGKSWRFTAENLADFDRHCVALADQIAKRKLKRIA
jgi:hypothetical protein